jgi:hypothetical protein
MANTEFVLIPLLPFVLGIWRLLYFSSLLSIIAFRISSP